MCKKGSVESLVIFSIVIVALLALFFVIALPQGSTPSLGNVVHDLPNVATGNFGLIAAKSFGGTIAASGSFENRAFSGRATDTLSQTCYSCSCISFGITAPDIVSAQRVCSDNCNGQILQNHRGPCT